MAFQLQAFGERDGEFELGGVTARGLHPRAGFAQGLGRAGEDHDLGLHEHRRELVAELDGLGQGEAGQVVPVFAGGGEGQRLLETPRRERDGVAETGKVEGEGRAPGAGANNDDIHRRGGAEGEAPGGKSTKRAALADREEP